MDASPRYYLYIRVKDLTNFSQHCSLWTSIGPYIEWVVPRPNRHPGALFGPISWDVEA